MNVLADRIRCRVCMEAGVMLFLTQHNAAVSVERTNFRFRAGDKIFISERTVVLRRDDVVRAFRRAEWTVRI